MVKAIVAEATARQAVSFVLGAVAALTFVVLVQYRAPAAGLSRARTHVQFSGWRSSDEQLYHSRNGSARQATPVVEAGNNVLQRHQANATLKANSSRHGVAVPSEGKNHLLHQHHANATFKVNSSMHGVAVLSRDHQEKDAEEFRGLAAAVSRAAMDDRTVIITCVNQAWAAPGSLLDMFLESFRIGDGTSRLLQHVLVVSMDAAAHVRCQAVHRHCYHYTMPFLNMDFTSAKFFGSREWMEMVWSKLKLQRHVLELGYGFLFTDVDILWFRDPFKHITAYADMTVSADVYFGDPDNLGNFPNTGFFHVKPNKRTIAMTKLWHESRSKYPGANEQPVFNMIKKQLVAELGVRLQYLDTAFVGGFCSYGKDLGKIVTMHANCCVGLKNKMKDLRSVLDDWKNYTRLPHWEKHRAKWTIPGACIKVK